MSTGRSLEEDREDRVDPFGHLRIAIPASDVGWAS